MITGFKEVAALSDIRITGFVDLPDIYPASGSGSTEGFYVYSFANTFHAD